MAIRSSRIGRSGANATNKQNRQGSQIQQQDKEDALARDAELSDSTEQQDDGPSAATHSETPVSSARPEPRLAGIWQNLIDDNTHNWLCCIDFGTTKIGVSAAINQNAEDPLDIHPAYLPLQGEIFQPTLLAVEFEGNKRIFRYGKAAERGLKDHTIKPGHVFRNLKQSSIFFSAQPGDKVKRKEYVKRMQDRHDIVLNNIKVRRGGSAYVRHPWLEDGEVRAKCRTMKDIVIVLLTLVVLDVKESLRMASRMSKAQIEEMFAGELETELGKKMKVGIGAPDLWKERRLALYEVMIAAGMPPHLEILSEAKCTAWAVLRKQLVERPERDRVAKMRALKRKTLVVIDRGGYSVDISAMWLRRDPTIVKFKAFEDILSSENGAQETNEQFISSLPTLFGARYNHVKDRICESGEQDPQNVLAEGFISSFEEVKRSGTQTGHVRIVYQGSKALSRGINPACMVTWTETFLELPWNKVEQYMLKGIGDFFHNNRKLKKYVRRVQNQHKGREIEIVVAGGGSSESVFCQKLDRTFQHLPMTLLAHELRSLVADGGVLALWDTELCMEQKTANRSYGVVYNARFASGDAVFQEQQGGSNTPSDELGADVEELPDTIKWLSTIGKAVSSEPVTYSAIKCIDRLGTAGDNKPFTFKLLIAHTDRAACATNVQYTKRMKGIKTTSLSFVIDPEIASKIGHGTSGNHGVISLNNRRCRLQFNYQLIHRWAGMLQFFEIRIPPAGVSGDEEHDRDSMFVYRLNLPGDCKVAAEVGNDSILLEDSD